MPLEACMIMQVSFIALQSVDSNRLTLVCPPTSVDNSDNGDYAPTRFAAQNDAVSLIFNAKTASNPENTVGVMSMAGSSPMVLATLTQDFGKVLSSTKNCYIGGSADLMTALNVAQLALKHRENKNQRQRIVAFVASPIGGGQGSSSGAAAGLEEQLVKLGKKMKKNNVAIDIILFGDEGMENEEVMGKFVEACQSGDNCHIVSIPPGPHLLSDLIASSPILAADGGAFAASAAAGASGDGDIDMAALGGGGGGGGDDFGGIDPSMDPELAMAIRMSLQEEEERQRRAAAGSSTESAPTDSAPAAATTTSTQDIPASEIPIEAPTATEAAQPAIPPPHTVAGSTTHAPQPESTTGSAPISTSGVLHDSAGDVEMHAGEEDEEADEDLLAAIAMSMQGAQEGDLGQEEDEKKS
ncbi:hypothetical protein QFC21_004799 [Naganishia friedmannii]|uniref:Uncharacterized protein n=1 Tax=Naganishia friedmannii TaxID=89922 RepID=A0ACC2VFA7_9TREE|nr:hypothetical protein QFC21_004799 [Naganishia friedmannii]